MCAADRPISRNGIIKWNEKKRLSVALSTAKPPQIHSTSICPM